MRETLYLLPGLLCDAFTFEQQRAALADDYDVRVLDFFGLDSMQSMAEKVFADAPEKFSVCGFSMGGRVSLQMMRMAPHRIQRLCLLDTGVTAAGPGEPAARQPLLDIAASGGMPAVAAAWAPPMVHPARRADPQFMGPLNAMVCRATPEIFTGQIRALLARPDATPLLASFKLPVYVVVGAQDEWATPAQHEAFARQIPGAKYIVIENSGHFTPLEQPQVLTRILREMMQEKA
jgi:pimeloyl-ACP methyl ester carboxylesterase